MIMKEKNLSLVLSILGPISMMLWIYELSTTQNAGIALISSFAVVASIVLTVIGITDYQFKCKNK